MLHAFKSKCPVNSWSTYLHLLECRFCPFPLTSFCVRAYQGTVHDGIGFHIHLNKRAMLNCVIAIESPPTLPLQSHKIPNRLVHQKERSPRVLDCPQGSKYEYGKPFSRRRGFSSEGKHPRRGCEYRGNMSYVCFISVSDTGEHGWPSKTSLSFMAFLTSAFLEFKTDRSNSLAQSDVDRATQQSPTSTSIQASKKTPLHTVQRFSARGIWYLKRWLPESLQRWYCCSQIKYTEVTKAMEAHSVWSLGVRYQCV